ncbi:MAG: hypothetical protein ACXVC7_17220, partial [Bacteroidia bacterium]
MNNIKKKSLVVLLLAIVCLNNLNAQKSNGIAAVTTKNSNRTKNIVSKKGAFITIKGSDGTSCRAYAAGPENATAG